MLLGTVAMPELLVRTTRDCTRGSYGQGTPPDSRGDSETAERTWPGLLTERTNTERRLLQRWSGASKQRHSAEIASVLVRRRS
jgi:hypothetical protein